MKKNETVKIPFYKSIFGKMTLAISFSFLVVIAVSFIWIYAGVKDSLRKRTDEELMRTYKQLEQNLTTFGKEVDQVALRVLNGSVLTNLVVQDKSEIENIERRMEFFNLTDTILAEYNFIDSIAFYSADQMILFADKRWNVTSMDGEERGKFYTERLENRTKVQEKDVVWYGGYQNFDFVKDSRKDQKAVNYVSMCKTIFRGKQCGYLVINVDLDYFVNYYNSVSADGSWSEETYMVDQYGVIISQTNTHQIGEEKKNLIRSAKEGPRFLELDKKLILCYPVAFCQWTLVNEKAVSEILGDIKDIQRIFILAIAAVTVILFFFLLFWVKYMTAPFMELINALKQVRKGNFGIVLKKSPENGDEISLLVDSFNKMSLEISSLITKNTENEKLKRDAQIKALKSQINPHFLYNTLNTVKWMAIVKGENEIVDCLEALAELVQPIFRDTRNKWLLEEEISYIENYCKIMNYRYGEKTEFFLEIAPDIFSAKVPKFILQPLVENSFFHGLAEKERQEQRKLVIGIRGEKTKKENRDFLELKVYDNGMGMSEEECRKLRESLAVKETGSHIGLNNIYQRIKLLYDVEGGVDICSNPGEGFQVMIRIPYEEEKW